MPDDASYQVVWSHQAIQTLRDFADGSASHEAREELARAVRLLDQRLRTDPLDVGEVYRTRGPVHEHLAVKDLLAIDFAVDTARKFVNVRSCRVRSG